MGIAFYGIKSYTSKKLFDEKVKIYRSYLKIISKGTLNGSRQEKQELASEYIKVKQEIICFAPENIVKLISELEPFNMSDKAKYQKYLELLNLMRYDLSKSKSISPDVLSKILV
ncbi:hypothetical protein KQH76_02905 [Streptococcus sanguinis]